LTGRSAFWRSSCPDLCFFRTCGPSSAQRSIPPPSRPSHCNGLPLFCFIEGTPGVGFCRFECKSPLFLPSCPYQELIALLPACFFSGLTQPQSFKPKASFSGTLPSFSCAGIKSVWFLEKSVCSGFWWYFLRCLFPPSEQCLMGDVPSLRVTGELFRQLFYSEVNLSNKFTFLFRP